MFTNKNFFKAVGIFTGMIGYSMLPLTPANAEEQQEQKKPNILWFFIEDMNPLLSCYGDTLIETTNMDRLADNGVLFENAFVPSPVSSPCRSAIITGSMPTTLGLHHHTSSVGEDEIYLPKGVKTLPEIFRESGYFTYNKGKEHYNFEFDMGELYSGTNENNKEHWSHRKEDQPFFAQIQLYGGKYVNHDKIFSNRDWSIDPEKAVKTLAENYPRHEVIKKHWAWHYDAVKLTDNAIGKVLNELEKDGLLENTIIFCFSDHGSHLPRDKQFTYEGGLHVPLIISYFGDKDYLPSGTRRRDLVNLIDVSATALGLANIEIPEWFESRDLFSKDHKKREYVISTKDRMGNAIDWVRSVRTKNFHYIRNFMTDRPYMQPQYRDGREYMKIMRNLHRNEKLPPVIDWFYDDYRPAEELYDLRKDPDETRNVARDSRYHEKLEEMRNILYSWVEKTNDQGQYIEETDGLIYWNQSDWRTGLLKNPEYDRLRQPWHQVPCHVEAEMPQTVKGIKYQITTDGEHGFETLIPDGKGGYELYVPGYPHRTTGKGTGNPHSAGEKVYEIYGAEEGDYVAYPIKARDNGEHQLTIRVATDHEDARIVIKNNNISLATVNVPNTGSNRSWQNVQTKIELEEGVNELKLYFEGNGEDLIHINWFRVTRP